MKVAVFFFGGFLASPLDIDKWLRSARTLKPTSFEFIGFPWPRGASADAAGAVKGFSHGGKLDSVIDDIQGNDADKIYIVGHSSGCAIANAVHAGLEYVGHHVLVALDGFKPNDDQLEDENTQVWGAMCEGKTSMNFPGPANGRRQIYTATNCKKTWPLHFSMVNTNSTDANTDLVDGDLSKGYLNCAANLCFLNPR
jgi:muramoyltetrapeptide carboxypeptidase LdcA involved in peptidoglycan recycling